MKALREIQESFQAYLLDEDNSIERRVVSNNQVSSEERLHVYHNGYYVRLIEILGNDFKALKKIIGEDKFNKTAYEYVQAYPSNHYSARYFGRHFSKFLSTYVEAKPEYAEIAKFEWGLGETIDAPDGPILTVEVIAQISPDAWPTLQFIAHPSLQLITFFYNAPEIWKAVDNETEVPSTVINDEAVTWMLWRYQRESYYCSTSNAERWMLQAFCDGKDFTEACEGLCEWLPKTDVAQFAAGTLRRWVEEGVFSDVRLQ